MREAEKYNKEILLAEKRLKEEAEKAAKFAAGKKGNSRLTATNGANNSVPAKDTSKLTQQQREALAYEKRRQELKDITMARRRYSATHSLTRLLTHSLTHLLTHSLTYSPTYLPLGRKRRKLT